MARTDSRLHGVISNNSDYWDHRRDRERAQQQGTFGPLTGDPRMFYAGTQVSSRTSDALTKAAACRAAAQIASQHGLGDTAGMSVDLNGAVTIATVTTDKVVITIDLTTGKRSAPEPNRPAGWYWIKRRGGWIVARWSMGRWNDSGGCGQRLGEVTEIGHRIYPPGEEPAPTVPQKTLPLRRAKGTKKT